MQVRPLSSQLISTVVAKPLFFRKSPLFSLLRIHMRFDPGDSVNFVLTFKKPSPEVLVLTFRTTFTKNNPIGNLDSALVIRNDVDSPLGELRCSDDGPDLRPCRRLIVSPERPTSNQFGILGPDPPHPAYRVPPALFAEPSV